MSEKFSVLMSIYIKEEPEYVRECFESLLNQTKPADEWVIVEDGPLTDELCMVLDQYCQKHPGLIKRIQFAENQGLGKSLREGILHCSHELIARMDTDDIAKNDRFEKQLNMFRSMPDLDICGSHIKEFDENINNIISLRKVPIDQKSIMKYQKKRDSFNHMTVMYKKASVLRAGNYQEALLMEDSLLWVNMLRMGARCINIDDFLVYARGGKSLIDRRGGWEYFKKYSIGRKMIYNTGYISRWDYLFTIVIQFLVSMSPGCLRQFIFKKLLRN